MKSTTAAGSCFCLALAFLFSPLQATGVEWCTSLPAAQQAAAALGKDILLVYQGDENCRPLCGAAEMVSSHGFISRAEKDFVLVALPAPAEEDHEGRAVRYSCLVFADAAGRPYYEAGEEWEWGVDWLLEELKIAAERRAVVAAIWQEMDSRPAGVAEWRYASRLFKAMPIGIERFYAPYQTMLAEALANGDCSQFVRATAQARHRERAEEMLADVLRCRSFEELAAYAQEHVRELNEIPTLGQAVWMSLASAQNLGRLSQDPRACLTPEGMEQLLQVYQPIIAVEPRTKLARFIRTQAAHYLRSTAAGMLMAASCKTNPQQALADLAAVEALDQSQLCRQSVALLRARVHAELGEWQKAMAEIDAAISADPDSANAEAASLLAQSIGRNYARLDELLPLRRRGDAAVDAEWDSLLAGRFDISARFTISTSLDLFYAEVDDEADPGEAQDCRATAAQASRRFCFTCAGL